jgi:hypothetical protein
MDTGVSRLVTGLCGYEDTTTRRWWLKTRYSNDLFLAYIWLFYLALLFSWLPVSFYGSLPSSIFARHKDGWVMATALSYVMFNCYIEGNADNKPFERGGKLRI